MEYNIYRLKGGLRPKSWQLPLQETFVKKFVEKNGEKTSAFKRIAYVPGTDSIFAEDHKGDLQPQSIWFSNGVLQVRKDDSLLNEILEKHPWLDKRFELWSQEAEDQDNLENLRLKSKSRQLIDEADATKIKAIALAVFEMEAAIWTDEKAELELRKFADSKPKKLQEIMDGKDYESKLLAGLAFTKGLVTENDAKTKVIWSDSQGEIIKLAKGEKGILELGRFFSQRTEDSELVIQSIGERLEQIETKTTPIEVELSEKDKEIARLKALLAKKGTDPEPVSEEQKELEEARVAYVKKFKKKVPVNKKNNLEWLNNRLGLE